MRNLGNTRLRKHDLNLVSRLTIDEQRQLKDAMSSAQIFETCFDFLVGALVLQIVFQVGREILRGGLGFASHVIVDSTLEQHPTRDGARHKNQQQQHRQKADELASYAEAR